MARLTGFRTNERSGLLLQVGTQMTINLALAVGGIEETVTVTGQSPLVDVTSARVGGNIGTAELSELPAMNRNYFASVALLPGVQFSPSTQMGNDTIIASGQSAQGNNVSVDGGYNIDDALGATAGAQVRTPIEAIQEFQVLTGRPQQGALLLQPRTTSGQPDPDASLSHAAGAQPVAGRGAFGLEHDGALRPPDQRDAHLGGSVFARVGAAVPHHPGPSHERHVSRRDRHRRDRGRYLDQRVRQPASASSRSSSTTTPSKRMRRTAGRWATPP